MVVCSVEDLSVGIATWKAKEVQPALGSILVVYQEMWGSVLTFQETYVM
jgi:hypothetical protein